MIRFLVALYDTVVGMDYCDEDELLLLLLLVSVVVVGMSWFEVGNRRVTYVPNGELYKMDFW